MRQNGVRRDVARADVVDVDFREVGVNGGYVLSPRDKGVVAVLFVIAPLTLVFASMADWVSIFLLPLVVTLLGVGWCAAYYRRFHPLIRGWVTAIFLCGLGFSVALLCENQNLAIAFGFVSALAYAGYSQADKERRHAR